MEGIAVACDDEAVVAEAFAPLGEGAANVVCFVAVDFYDRDTKGAAGVAGRGALGLEVVGHALPGAFVGGHFNVPKGGDGRVKGGEYGVGLFSFQDGEEHEDEGVDGIGGGAVGCGEGAHGEEASVEEAVAVEDDEFGHGLLYPARVLGRGYARFGREYCRGYETPGRVVLIVRWTKDGGNGWWGGGLEQGT